MFVLTVCLSIWSSSIILPGVSTISHVSRSLLFTIRPSHRVQSGASEITQVSRPGMTTALCAMICANECGQFQVNHASGTCVTFKERLYIQPEHNAVTLTSDPEWTMGYVDYSPGEDLVLAFRAQKETNTSLYDTWIDNGVHHDDPVPVDFPQACLRLTDYESCDRHFRSKILDAWVDIKEIRVSWIKSGIEVAYIVFNGTATDNQSWFSPHRILSSTWAPDIITDEYHSPTFKGLSYLYARRRLYLYGPHVNCTSEWFYTMTVDFEIDKCITGSDQSPSLSFPIFFYSPSIGRASFGMNDEYPQPEQADVLAFWVKFA